ncbi:MAG: DUF427 domain-containing protein [Bacteroidota bacterium]
MDTPKKVHYANIDNYSRRLILQYQGREIAATDRALILKEVSGKRVFDPVFYVPQEDIEIDLVRDPESKGYCPIKGKSYRWYLKENPTEEYFGWSYEDPLPEAIFLRGHIAFNGRYVTFVSAPRPL